MKIKPKSKIGSSKSKKSKVSTVFSPRDKKIVSGFKEEIINDLYKFAFKGKSKGLITLTEIEYPEECKAKVKILDKLKREGFIKKYALLPSKEEEFHPSKRRRPSELEIEVNPDILLQQTPQEYVYYHPCNASIEFNKSKVINHCKETKQRERVEKSLRKEQILICNGLKLGLESGNAVYGRATTNFLPAKQEYKLLRALMKKLNERLSYEDICKTVFGKKRWNPQGKNTTVKREISFIIRNIKRKLKILGKEASNKDLFFPCNGYRIVCDQRR